jgi:Xaa-Pro aminopeptidase
VDYPAQRRQQLLQALAKEGVEALLISNPINVTYLTGFSGESSFLVLGPERVLLISDARFTKQIAEECPGLEVHIRSPAQSVQQATAEVLTKLGLATIAFESSHLTVGEWEMLRELAPAITWKSTRDLVEKLRAVKDASEVAEIREAIAIAERAFAAFRALLGPTDSEKALCDALEYYVRRCGGRCTSFPSIIAAGERAALPHAPPTERTVHGAELLLVDWGACGRFYKSDLTRVLVPRKNLASVPSGSPSPYPLPLEEGGEGRVRGEHGKTKLEQIYEVVLRAQSQALKRIRPGVKGHEVDAAARGVIAEAGFGDFFGHGLGHGVGLQIHEAPSLRPNSQSVLQAGMVVTVEPGIYLPGWGGVRIEDDVLITPDGCEVLTSVPRDLRFLMLDF